MPAVNDACLRGAAAVPNVRCVTVLNMFGVLWKYTRIRSMQMGTVCGCVKMRNESRQQVSIACR